LLREARPSALITQATNDGQAVHALQGSVMDGWGLECASVQSTQRLQSGQFSLAHFFPGKKLRMSMHSPVAEAEEQRHALSDARVRRRNGADQCHGLDLSKACSTDAHHVGFCTGVHNCKEHRPSRRHQMGKTWSVSVPNAAFPDLDNICPWLHAPLQGNAPGRACIHLRHNPDHGPHQAGAALAGCGERVRRPRAVPSQRHRRQSQGVAETLKNCAKARKESKWAGP
jgi:hypothetical protein